MTRYTVVLSLSLLALADTADAADPISIGSRLELFVDRHLVESLDGDAALKLHRPQPREVVLTTDEPWEGNTSAYYTFFQDGDLYRAYYRGAHYDEKTAKAGHREVTCYAESRDGIHWTKPELGIFEFGGSKKNNIVWDGIGTHCFAAFKDANPVCPPDARYKGIARGRPRGEKGLYVFKSPDGIHWSMMHDDPVITLGDFDSQNLAFWDPVRKLYVAYHRRSRDGKRDIMTETSTDFLTWTEPVYLDYPGAPKEHLYTNAILPYSRAPHIRLGFPTRYQPKNSQVEPTLMASRDGLTFHRWPEALIPISAPKDRDGNRSNYMTWGLLDLPGRTRGLSVYASEAYYTGPDSRVRRFTFRVDGFVSFHASMRGGTLLTKTLQFTGDRLVLNYDASKAGGVRVQLETSEGQSLDGYSLADCGPLRGDAVEQAVVWNGGAVEELAGKPLRIRFEARSADVYSFRFTSR